MTEVSAFAHLDNDPVLSAMYSALPAQPNRQDAQSFWRDAHDYLLDLGLDELARCAMYCAENGLFPKWEMIEKKFAWYKANYYFREKIVKDYPHYIRARRYIKCFGRRAYHRSMFPTIWDAALALKNLLDD